MIYRNSGVCKCSELTLTLTFVSYDIKIFLNFSELPTGNRQWECDYRGVGWGDILTTANGYRQKRWGHHLLPDKR